MVAHKNIGYRNINITTTNNNNEDRKQTKNSYPHGGLKMVDIDVFIKCQKLT